MNFTKVYNPSESEVALQFLGETYTIGAGKSAEFPADVAKHWITIYGFMSLEESNEKKEIKEEGEEVLIEKKDVKSKAVKKK